MGGRKIKSDHPSTVCNGSQRRVERQRHLVIIVFSTISRLLFLCYFSSLCSQKRLWDVYYHTVSVDIFFLFNFVFFSRRSVYGVLLPKSLAYSSKLKERILREDLVVYYQLFQVS